MTGGGTQAAVGQAMQGPEPSRDQAQGDLPPHAMTAPGCLPPGPAFALPSALGGAQLRVPGWLKAFVQTGQLNAMSPETPALRRCLDLSTFTGAVHPRQRLRPV